MSTRRFSYLTHDNGGRPYLVKIEKTKKGTGTCSVYKKPESTHLYSDFDEDDLDVDANGNYIRHIVNYMEHIKTYRFVECFDYDCSWSPGNSVLLNLDNGRYVFIGNFIFEFESYGKIIEFHSPVGNNDVPYPYAIDNSTNGPYIYFFIENAIVKMDDGFKDCHDTYWEYYTRTDKPKKGQKRRAPVCTMPWKNVKCIDVPR